MVELYDPQHPTEVLDIKNIENAISLEHIYETRKFGRQSAGINDTNAESVSSVITAIGLYGYVGYAQKRVRLWSGRSEV